MSTNSAETPCFIPFNEDVSHIKLPEKLNFPFYYDVHPLCEIAAKQVQHFLGTNDELQHNFGLENNSNLLPIGKMFGVLIIENKGTLGFLAAYSGKLANSNSVAFFVPPVFDMLTDNGYFLRKEEELNAINREIESLKNNTDLKDHQRKRIDLEAIAKQEINSFKEKIKINKQTRKQERI